MAQMVKTGVPVTSAPPRTATVDGVTFSASMLENQDVWDILVACAAAKTNVEVTYEVDPGPPLVVTSITRVKNA